MCRPRPRHIGPVPLPHGIRNHPESVHIQILAPICSLANMDSAALLKTSVHDGVAEPSKVQSHLLKLSKLCGEKAAHNQPPSVITSFGHCPYVPTRCSKKHWCCFRPSQRKAQGKPPSGCGGPGPHKSKPPFPHLHPGPAHHNNRWEGALVELDPRHNPLGLEEVPGFLKLGRGFPLMVLHHKKVCPKG